jgi:hypothetical protein
MSGEKEKDPTLRELKKISKILTLANAPVIEKELSKIANSDARKIMWVLIDGKRMPKDIAQEVGVTQMAVSYFLNAACTAEAIEYTQREPPRRMLDYVPPSWIELTLKQKAEAEQEAHNEEKSEIIGEQLTNNEGSPEEQEKDGENKQ